MRMLKSDMERLKEHNTLEQRRKEMYREDVRKAMREWEMRKQFDSTRRGWDDGPDA